jgi:hypothetical protein
MQDGCKSLLDSYMASNESRFMVTWTTFKNHLLEGGRPNTKPGDHGTPNVHNPLIYSFLSCVRTRVNRKFIEIAFG